MIEVFLNEENKESNVTETAGTMVKNYFLELEKTKKRNIESFVELVRLCYRDNSYSRSEDKISVAGKSTKPACYIKFAAPFDKNSFLVLDIKAKEIELSAKSAIAPKDIIKIFKDFDEDELEEVKDALAAEDLALKVEDGKYLIYPDCLEEKASKIEL